MSKRKLLLADDSVTIQKVVNLTFADEGIEVFTVGNGSAAIEKLNEIEPDLVLADVHMPGLNGYEVCEQVRQNPQFKDVPVMLLVGSFEPFDEAEMRRVGASDYLTKPFQSIRQLVQKVNALLDSSASVASDAAAPESIEADVANPEQEDSSAFQSTIPTFVAPQRDYDFSFAGDDAPARLGDPGMDDEMIETTSTTAGGSLRPSEAAAEAAALPEYDFQTGKPEEAVSENNSEAATQTAPLSSADIQEINYSMLSPLPTKTEDIGEIEMIEPEAEDSYTIDLDADEPQPSATDFETQQSTVTEFEFAPPLATEDAPPASDAAVDSAEVFEIADFETTGETNAVEADTAQTTEATAANTETAETSFVETAEKNPFSFDDDDDDSILDLQLDEPEFDAPFPEELKTEGAADAEQTPLDAEVMPPSQALVQNISENQSEYQSDNQLAPVGGQAVANSGGQFPPEVIDAIAERVVERLSDKVIEKIAWEIVPDRFDLIVRKHMENRER